MYTEEESIWAHLENVALCVKLEWRIKDTMEVLSGLAEISICKKWSFEEGWLKSLPNWAARVFFEISVFGVPKLELNIASASFCVSDRYKAQLSEQNEDNLHTGDLHWTGILGFSLFMFCFVFLQSLKFDL